MFSLYLKDLLTFLDRVDEDIKESMYFQLGLLQKGEGEGGGGCPNPP